MPRYVVTTLSAASPYRAVEPAELPDEQALIRYLSRSLGEMIGENRTLEGATGMSAWATDETGQVVMVARVNLTVTRRM